MNQAKVLVHQGLCMCGTLDTSSLWILVQNAKCCSLVKKKCSFSLLAAVRFSFMWSFVWCFCYVSALCNSCVLVQSLVLSLLVFSGTTWVHNCFLFKEAAGQLSFSCATQICDSLVRDVDSLMLVL